ncbi:MAG TPA: HAMP domain-containing sensor histidine kinase [Pyrinomonadaceae bacterium]|nr:HAMP domain-containing sensor histidine kinase [Pyrinomonadaceae bacterium]
MFSGKKLFALASIVVLLPLTVLTLLQYRSLSELESRTKDAFKENLRQTLLAVERAINARFEAIAGNALVPIGSFTRSPDGNPEKLEEHFSAIKRSNPEVDRIFVISTCGCKNEKDGYAYYYSNDRQQIEELDPKASGEVHAARHSFEESRSAETFLDSNRRFMFWQHYCSDCSDGAGKLTTYIFFPYADESRQGQIGFAGITLNENYIKNDLIARSIAEALSSPDLALPAADVVISVTDDKNRQIYTSSPGEHEYPIKTSFGRPFSNWQAAIGFREAGVETLARKSFWQNILLSLFVFALIAAGLMLLIRTTTREIRLAQAKSAFVSNVSHELKTPLSLIRLFAEMLELGQVRNNEKRYEYYRIIGDESRRLGTLIDNILDFSKIEAGHKVYNFVYEDIGEVVESVVGSYRHQITRLGFELKVKIGRNIPQVLIDRDAMAQAILNLLDNAIKYSGETKEILVEAKTTKSQLSVEVSDRGMGIPNAEHKKIFDKFYRIGNDMIHNVKGSGLGLSLVKHIVEAHKGQIFVQSQVGHGTRFIICIPLETAGEKSMRFHPGEAYQIAQNTDN